MHSHDPASPAVGDDINYFFTVHNNGPDQATNITLNIAAFNGQVYQGSASPYPFIDNGDGRYIATIGSIGAGSDATFRISFHVTQVAAIYAYLEVDSPDDPDSSNNTAEEDAQVSGGATADLTVTSVTVAPNPANVGDLRHYHGTVTNNGPDEATDVAVAIQADSQDSNGFGFDAYESFDHSVPSPNPPGADANGIRYIPVGNIAAHASVSFDAFYSAVQQGSFNRNFFLSLSGAEVDPNLNNNHFVVPSTINQGTPTNSADLRISVTAPTSTTVGSNITYHFHVANDIGPNTAHGIQATVAPSPTNEQIVSATVPYTVNAHGAIVQVPDLDHGASYDFTFVFEATEPGEIDLTSSASSTTTDPNGSNNSVTKTTHAAPAPAPPHGGLSPTSFTVDESYLPLSNVSDTVLRFAADQTGRPADLVVRVQYTTSTAQNPPESTWHDLANSNSGHMTYDTSSKKFVLSSLNYPLVNGVSFRAIASASGYPDSISNKVGLFNLASSKPRLAAPFLSVTGNGPFADLYFRTIVSATTSGMTERIQQSTSPFDESSWADLTDGQSGAMKQSNDPKRFYLLANKVTPGRGVYFRAVASRSGYADGISGPKGPFAITSDIPPVVNVQLPAGLTGSGTGHSASSPILFQQGTIHLVATASGQHGIKKLKLCYDGSTIDERGSGSIATDYTTTVIGDHVIEAVAVDTLGATSRAGTDATYIRILPKTAALLEAATSSGSVTTSAASVAGKTYTIAHSGGNWNDPATWKDEKGKNGVPGANDLAIVGTSTVRCPYDVVVKSVTLSGGKIIGPGTLDILGIITISAGTFENSVLDILDDNAVCELTNSVDIQFSGTVINHGKWNVHGSGGLLGMDFFHNYGTTNFQTPLVVPANAGKDPTLDNRIVSAASVQNAGLLRSDLTTYLLADGSVLISQDGNGLIGQDGNGLIGQDGNGLIDKNGGSLIGQDGNGLIGQDGNGLIGQDGNGLIGQDGNGIVAQGGGSFVTQSGHAIQGGNVHSEVAYTETVSSGFVQSGGETDLDGLSVTGPVTLEGGVLTGSGIIYGSLTNNKGYIMPGHSAGFLGVTGNFKQGAQGNLVFEEGGTAIDKFGQLAVGGVAALGGNLQLRTVNGYIPNAANTFSPLSFASASGRFAAVSSNATATIKSTGIITTVNPAKPSPKASQALNISTRAKVQTRDNVVIAGFIVTGPAGSTKKVIVRGLGPSLASAGIQGALLDPYIELRHGATLLASNDNWRQRQAEVQASGIPPKNDLESAIVATLAPGAYTVTLRGAHNEIGVGLIEVYDLAEGSSASLGNISTRCQVLTSDQVMIGGFILKGGLPSKIVVRAIGPSLTKAGVKGVLADPLLELHDANGMSITNDNWRATQESEIIATTIPPTDNREAAIVATLPPGPYTAIVRGANDTTGVALVEAYNLQ